jgi:hypothetical protein
LHESYSDISENRFVGKKFGTDSMDSKSAVLNVTFRIDIKVQIVAGGSVVDQFQRANFDDAMALSRAYSRRFGIQNNFAHYNSIPARHKTKLPP